MATPYDNRSIEEIRNLIINSIQQKFNNTLKILPKSFTRILAIILAGVFIIAYKQIGWLFLQIFPDKAYFGEINVLGSQVRPLVKWGVLLGIGEPRRGSQWAGNARITVTKINSVLNIGTQLKSDLTGKIYVTDENKTLENTIETVSILCSDSGAAGNLEPGEPLYFVNPLGNVEKAAQVDAVAQEAMDEETEAEYRYRVVSRWRMQPQGGALADYRIWGMEASGVLNIYPYKDASTPSGVFIYVSGIPSVYADRIPSSALLIAVGKSCTYNPETGKATRKPLTATIDPTGDEAYLNVKPVSIIIFDVYIEGLTGIPAFDFSQAVKTPIEEYFLGREPYNRGLSDDNNRTDLVSKNNVLSVVDQVAISHKAEFESVVMKRMGNIIPSYALGQGELCKLGNLYIDGVLF
jgi:uncharacterized phage protein gp47/JayE